MRNITQRYAFSVSVMGRVTKIRTVLNKNESSGHFCWFDIHWNFNLGICQNCTNCERLKFVEFEFMQNWTLSNFEKLFKFGTLQSCMFGFVLCIIMVLYKNDDSSFFSWSNGLDFFINCWFVEVMYSILTTSFVSTCFEKDFLHMEIKSM